MSKGSQPRPYSVDQTTFDANWDRIFAKKPARESWDHYSDLPAPESYQDDKEKESCNG